MIDAIILGPQYRQIRLEPRNFGSQRVSLPLLVCISVKWPDPTHGTGR
jgi:hypothetical protein